MNTQNGQHPSDHPGDSSKRSDLGRPFTFWYSFSGDKQRLRREDYEHEIKKLGTFASIEKFWSYYQHMVRPEKLPIGSKFVLFQEGIKPAWEDKENQNGGSFILRVKTNYANKFWEDLVLSFIGEQCDCNDAVCGLFLNVKPNEVNLSIWTKPLDEEAKDIIEEWIRKTLGFNDGTRVEYRYHPRTTTEEPHPKPQPKRFERNDDWRKKSDHETRT